MKATRQGVRCEEEWRRKTVTNAITYNFKKRTELGI